MLQAADCKPLVLGLDYLVTFVIKILQDFLTKVKHFGVLNFEIESFKMFTNNKGTKH